MRGVDEAQGEIRDLTCVLERGGDGIAQGKPHRDEGVRDAEHLRGSILGVVDGKDDPLPRALDDDVEILARRQQLVEGVGYAVPIGDLELSSH